MDKTFLYGLKFITMLGVVLLAGCESSNPFQPTPKMVVHAITQNHQGVQEENKKQQKKLQEMLRLPDHNRPLDRKKSIEVINSVAGVASSRWLNQSTILIQPSAYFGVSTIDDSCAVLETVGDSRWAIVAVEIYDGATTFLQWQNCRLRKGEVAFGNMRPPARW